MIELVATPIGNLEDLSPRAREAFEKADVVAAEDTRRTGRLLQAAGLKKRMVAYHEHNERHMSATLVEWAGQGQRIAVATDGGTPGVSDPGFTLVRAAARAGVEITMVPGPVAFVMAAVLSGLPVHGITFRGFPPKKSGQRQRFLEVDIASPHTLVLYESPHRIGKLVDACLEVYGDRPAALARELTKLHEEVVRGRLSEIKAFLDGRGTQPTGECCLVIAGAEVAADWFEAE
ncbi:16S rRNA (cytidine(1402)-2'-O)-methyltransferase [Thalassobaculum sp. OXR-137]|uniref:16S rRNA (cytidine(1402)-2'-O)-methyltransferase n=1 Tax=Thalassobaculum sp. OXR-137 TaxID=3100173 RepID=UPI002AC93C5F|nr:16S rRNA (cytidine(1402)-2'-O)-methyltransferase [Thalassobaculum sp. OXR-137]WPZ33370.1 16S rRNA (cytidine(1402)-2'-O)-methyltransferase [Thalassobaculum sp. OXR-137]